MNYQEILIECAKNHDIHNINGVDFWMKTEDLLFIIQDRPVPPARTWRCCFKPLYSDEVFWRIAEVKLPSVTWEDFRKKGTSRRVNGVQVAPSKKLSFCTYQLPSSEEEIRALYENKILEFLDMVKNVKETDYKTDAELSMINILRAIHEKDYARAKKLTKKIISFEIPPFRVNKYPEDEVMLSDYYPIWKDSILKYLQKIQE